jgi:hypothetical protein
MLFYIFTIFKTFELRATTEQMPALVEPQKAKKIIPFFSYLKSFFE